jgi:HK97 family phage prohead protease
MKTRETRGRKGLQLRQLTDDEKKAGYIGALVAEIPFNSDSGLIAERHLNHGKPFIEQIHPDAFKRSLEKDRDIMGFVGHTDDPLSSFARIGENMTITSNEKVMSVRALVPDTQAGRDLMCLSQRNIIQGVSFEFAVNGDGEKWEKRGQQDLRVITDARLYAINPVAWPAYDDSSLTVSMRSKARRGQYMYDEYEYQCGGDGSMSHHVAYAWASLQYELKEVYEAQEYLRACPDGPMAAYAKAEVADAQEDVKTLMDFILANGGVIDADTTARAQQLAKESREAAKPASDNQPPLALWEKRLASIK